MEMMVSIGILSVSILALTWIFVNLSQRQSTQNLIMALEQNRAFFQVLISSDAAWSATKQNNPNMACLQNASSCSGVGAQSFKLYDQFSQIFYDGTNPASGLTSNGSPCMSYPNSPCVLHVNLTWYPQCDVTTNIDPNCLAPYVQLQGSYTYSSSRPLSFVLSKYNFTYGRAVMRILSLNLPCPAPAPSTPCLNSWVCMGPTNSWQCHFLAP